MRWAALLVVAAACGAAPPKPAPPPPVDDDPPQAPDTVLVVQPRAPAAQLAQTAPAPPPPPPPNQPCTHARAEAELRAGSGAELAAGAIDAAFEHCVFDRVTDCQFALDHDVGKAIACWDKAPWPELPLIMSADDVAKTTLCLREVKSVEADVRACATKPAAERDACIAPYLDYAPSCALLDAAASWRAFAAEGHLDQAGQEAAAEARRAAEAAARAAKEAERCHGRTTLDLAAKLRADAALVPAKNCTYAVTGRVASSNNVYVELVDPTTGGSAHLLRTREPFADGATITDRAAIFEKLDQAELADGGALAMPVFKLMPR